MSFPSVLDFETFDSYLHHWYGCLDLMDRPIPIEVHMYYQKKEHDFSIRKDIK
jgi:hypothetical protein